MEQTKVSRKRAPLVEDEPNISRVCARTLSAEGFEVDTAVNGEIALQILRKKQYDLCLIDIRTPVMSGIELYRCWEKESPESIKVVIFTTGDVLSGDTRVFLEQTGRPYLPKPFTLDELRAVVRRALPLN